ncbi:hypothetical protein HDU88_005665 [Geranomyces variabilis]|nr:hypothetical protein HDU88_005665 [Geranomyces variabilis]
MPSPTRGIIYMFLFESLAEKLQIRGNESDVMYLLYYVAPFRLGEHTRWGYDNITGETFESDEKSATQEALDRIVKAGYRLVFTAMVDDDASAGERVLVYTSSASGVADTV